MKLQAIWKLLRETVSEYQQDKASLWAAAIAFYTLFSLAPLLIIAIAVAGLFFGQDAAQNELIGQLRGLIGQEGAEAIQAMIKNAYRAGSQGILATLFGIITLLLGATGIFGQLQDALNTIWDAHAKPGANIKGIVRNRVLSFAMVLVIGFLLLVSLVLSTVLSTIGNFLGQFIGGWVALAQILNFMISFGVITLLFALIYKVLPDIKLPWRYLWVGASFTSLLFTIGKFFIGLYLGNSSVGSSYGAAGSLVVVLIWIYYSAQILLFGAEFTEVYSRRFRTKASASGDR
jgi:membrane protein